jgi:CheY-like chemotaxis protein
LGLAIASRLVEMMDGHIWVESQPRRGSTFFFNVHLGVADVGPSSLAADRAKSLTGLRVLVVDDNAISRDVAEEMLGNWGLRPTCTSSPTEAIQMLGHQEADDDPFRVALVDSQMPGQDGFFLVDWIRHQQHLDCPTVMMLTSGDHKRSVTHCEELAVAAYLLKPVKQSELFDAIVLAIDPVSKVYLPEVVGHDVGPAVRKLNILLAEDSLVNQKLALGVLNRRGHKVHVANNGKEAVAAVDNGEFDLILMDVQMPEMDGLEATSMIRARQAVSENHTPIIAMTAHAMKGDREACLEAGMDGYVSKPIRAPKLFEVIDTVMAEEDPGGAERVIAGQQPPDHEHVDWTRALEVVQGDRELLRELVIAFLEECPKFVQEIHTSIDSQDYTLLHRAAHTLKGSMRYFGATDAFNYAFDLERLGSETKIDGARQKFETLQGELDRVLPALSQFAETGEIP